VNIPNLHIRQLTGTDAGTYRALRLVALQAEPDAFVSTYASESQKPELFLEKCLKANDPFNIAFGVFTGESLAGIGGFVKDWQPKTAHKGEIIQLYVDPNHRGQQIGRKLLITILNHAFEQFDDLLAIKIAVVLSKRNARTLYESLGFEPYGREPQACHSDQHIWDILYLQISRQNWQKLISE
jgi:GNAT superfamily N-acetyltransferase